LPLFKIEDFFQREEHEDGESSKIKIIVRKKDISESDLDIPLEDPRT
jgi:hypothetical protein